MANRDFKNVQALNREVKIISGIFYPNGTSAVANASNKGKGFSVARTTTGQFTITLEDAYEELIGFSADLALASEGDQFLQWGAIDVSSAKTLVLNVWDVSDAALADIAANAGNYISFTLILRNSGVQ